MVLNVWLAPQLLSMQMACPQKQSSGVFSIASHWVLQYLPDVVLHEQTGCAHFSPFAVAISLSPSFISSGIRNSMLDAEQN